MQNIEIVIWSLCKMDMKRVHDCMDWAFLGGTLQGRGFIKLGLVEYCEKESRFDILINSSPTDMFQSIISLY